MTPRVPALGENIVDGGGETVDCDNNTQDHCSTCGSDWVTHRTRKICDATFSKCSWKGSCWQPCIEDKAARDLWRIGRDRNYSPISPSWTAKFYKAFHTCTNETCNIITSSPAEHAEEHKGSECKCRGSWTGSTIKESKNWSSCSNWFGDKEGYLRSWDNLANKLADFKKGERIPVDFLSHSTHSVIRRGHVIDVQKLEWNEEKTKPIRGVTVEYYDKHGRMCTELFAPGHLHEPFSDDVIRQFTTNGPRSVVERLLEMPSQDLKHKGETISFNKVVGQEIKAQIINVRNCAYPFL